MAESFLSLRVSKDGAKTWSDWRARSLGDTGDFLKEAVWRRLGNARHFTFDFRADGVPDIVAAYLLGQDGQWHPAPIVGGDYSLNPKLASAQQTVNYIPERIEQPGGAVEYFLRGAPGFRLFANVGDGPIRADVDVEGKRFVVSGTEVYLVARDTSSTLLGSLPGEGPVSVAHNQEGGGAKVVFGNGTRGWTYDTITQVYAEITDDAFPGFLCVDYLDQFILGIEPQRRYAFHSDLANAREYSFIDVFEAEGSPDRLMGQAVINGQWWLFGERTTEIFANTGAATGTFQRVPGATIDRGLASTFAVAKLDNALWILGDDGIVYRSNGYGFQRVSDHALEQDLRLRDVSRVVFRTFEDAGHKVLYLTCPDGYTWGYDVATQLWHRRESFGLSRWRMATLTKWAGVWFVGDYQHGKLYQLDWNLKDEDGTTLTGHRTTGALVSASSRFTVSGVKVLCDTGRGPQALTGITDLIEPLVIYNRIGTLTQGIPVTHQYLSAGGVRPHTFSITAGALPDDLEVDSDGLIDEDTPQDLGNVAWRVTVEDAQGFTASLDEGQSEEDGIEGPDPIEVGVPPPALVTNLRHYGGVPESLLVATDLMGWGAGINRVRVTDDGLHAFGWDSLGIATPAWRVYDPDTEAWSAMSAPVAMPVGAVLCARWSPDNLHLAVGTNTNASPNNFILYKIVAGVVTKVADSADPLPDENILGVNWDDDGTRLALAKGSSVYGGAVYDFVSGELVNLREFGYNAWGAGKTVAFMPGVGSRYLAMGHGDPVVSVWRITEDPVELAVGMATNAYVGIHWDRTGAYLYAVGNGDGATPYMTVLYFQGSVIDAETLEEVVGAVGTQPASAPTDSAVTPSGEYLAVATGAVNFPLIYVESEDLPPTLDRLTDPASAGGSVTSVDWTQYS